MRNMFVGAASTLQWHMDVQSAISVQLKVLIKVFPSSNEGDVELRKRERERNRKRGN